METKNRAKRERILEQQWINLKALDAKCVIHSENIFNRVQIKNSFSKTCVQWDFLHSTHLSVNADGLSRSTVDADDINFESKFPERKCRHLVKQTYRPSSYLPAVHQSVPMNCCGSLQLKGLNRQTHKIIREHLHLKDWTDKIFQSVTLNMQGFRYKRKHYHQLQ